MYTTPLSDSIKRVLGERKVQAAATSEPDPIIEIGASMQPDPREPPVMFTVFVRTSEVFRR